MIEINIFTSISNEIYSKNCFITSYIDLSIQSKMLTYTEIINNMEEGFSIISAVPFEDKNEYDKEYLFELLYTSLIQIVIDSSLTNIIKKYNKINRKLNKVNFNNFCFIINLPLSLSNYKNRLEEELKKHISIDFNVIINQSSINYYNSYIISKTLETENIKG